MARILIDTDELRSLSTLYWSGQRTVDNIRSTLGPRLHATELNPDDPAIRSANLHDHQRRLDEQLARIARELDADGDRFRGIAQEVELSQGDWGTALLEMPVWQLLGGSGGAGGALVLGGLGAMVGLTAVERLADRMGFGRGGLLSDVSEWATAVGRTTTSGLLGLVGDAGRGFVQMAARFADRLQHLVEQAWEDIWQRVTERFRSMLRGLQGIGGWFQDTWNRHFGPSEMLAGERLEQHWHYQGNTNACAVYAQTSIAERLLHRDLDPLEELEWAKEHGYYDDGTRAENTTRILEEKYGLNVDRDSNRSIDDIYAALRRGDGVMVHIDGNEIWSPQHVNGKPVEQPKMAGHAVWVTGIVKRPNGEIQVIINDSGDPDGAANAVDLDDFLNAWSEPDAGSNNFAAFISRPAQDGRRYA